MNWSSSFRCKSWTVFFSWTLFLGRLMLSSMEWCSWCSASTYVCRRQMLFVKISWKVNNGWRYHLHVLFLSFRFSTLVLLFWYKIAISFLQLFLKATHLLYKGISFFFSLPDFSFRWSVLIISNMLAIYYTRYLCLNYFNSVYLIMFCRTMKLILEKCLRVSVITLKYGFDALGVGSIGLIGDANRAKSLVISWKKFKVDSAVILVEYTLKGPAFWIVSPATLPLEISLLILSWFTIIISSKFIILKCAKRCYQFQPMYLSISGMVSKLLIQ